MDWPLEKVMRHWYLQEVRAVNEYIAHLKHLKEIRPNK